MVTSLLVLLLSATATGNQPESQFVNVGDGVRVEVLDRGGVGRLVFASARFWEHGARLRRFRSEAHCRLSRPCIRNYAPGFWNIQQTRARIFNSGTYQRRTGEAFPAAEVRNKYAINADGSIGNNRTPPYVGKKIDGGSIPKDYREIDIPVLALIAVRLAPPEKWNARPNNRRGAARFRKS